MKNNRSLRTALAVALLTGLAAPAAFAQSAPNLSRSSVAAFSSSIRSWSDQGRPGAAQQQQATRVKAHKAMPDTRVRVRPRKTMGIPTVVSPPTMHAHAAEPSYEVHFAPQAGNESLVSYTSGQAKISFTLVGAHHVAAELSASGALYQGILPGVDVSYQLDQGGLKENLILHSSNVPTSYSFIVKTAHIFVRDDAQKGLVFYDDQTRKPIALIPNPVVTDAHGIVSRTAATLTAVPDHTGQFTISVHMDRAWLRADQRAFPVTIDPSIVQVTGPALPAVTNTLGKVDYGSLAIPLPSASVGPQEVLALRSNRSQTFINPNGTFTTRLYPTHQF
ncbi:MAG: hypothetical protein OWT28_00740 [Firmicutes bacterium]|nr:hypothetical protein [Bacillota bacterium]